MQLKDIQHESDIISLTYVNIVGPALVNIVGPAIAVNLQPLTHRRNVASLSLFYNYNNGHCCIELATLVSSTKVSYRVTHHSIKSHPFSVAASNCFKNSYLSSFFPRTSVLWNSLPSSCFPDSYNLRRCDTESGHGGRVFNPSWTTDYFVHEQSNSIICLICLEKIAVCKSYNVNRHYTTKHAVSYDKFKGQFRIDKIELLKKTFLAQQSVMKTKVISSYSATKISFLMAEAIAKSGKPFCTGDLLKNCLKIFCKEICPEKTPTVEDLSLSHQTIAGRVEDLSKNIELSLKEKLNKCEAYSLALDESTDRGDTAQLAIFIRGITSNFEVIEELLDINQMKDTTRGEDILSEVKKTLVKFELPEKKLCGVTTDGASALTGKNIGFIALLKKSINHEIISYHCIIHQEQLCAKVLEMKNVMELVIHTVNFIRSRGLNHRQFKQLLEGCGSEAEDVIYFSQVRWLSRAATLKRFWILLPEIVLFLKIKGKDTSLLEYIDCLNDLTFLIDMTQISKVLIHFKALSERNINTIDSERYCTLILKLIDEFDTRFCDFKKEKNELDLFAHPFSIKAETVRNEFQMELIELQNNKDLK
ncbi:general transcription factor II-I repeat domain-containing protein 2A-like [Hydra vulgaris]|uniref:General transcription factor II-I repeat domain-containing protein 2A-like n=1 Tax=Hydra vulgaris TaxID=6087 RepID=A0ABM4CUX4_HYDVU